MAAQVKDRLQELTSTAADVAGGLKKVAAGKPPEAATHSNAQSFARIADMLTRLSEAANSQATRLEQALSALDRISELKIRGATELLEQGNWKKIVGELQSIAQDAAQRIRAS